MIMIRLFGIIEYPSGSFLVKDDAEMTVFPTPITAPLARLTRTVEERIVNVVDTVREYVRLEVSCLPATLLWFSTTVASMTLAQNADGGAFACFTLAWILSALLTGITIGLLLFGGNFIEYDEPQQVTYVTVHEPASLASVSE